MDLTSEGCKTHSSVISPWSSSPPASVCVGCSPTGFISSSSWANGEWTLGTETGDGREQKSWTNWSWSCGCAWYHASACRFSRSTIVCGGHSVVFFCCFGHSGKTQIGIPTGSNTSEVICGSLQGFAEFIIKSVTYSCDGSSDLSSLGVCSVENCISSFFEAVTVGCGASIIIEFRICKHSHLSCNALEW